MISAELVVADRADRAGLRPRIAQATAVPPAVPATVMAISSMKIGAAARRDRRDRPPENVKDIEPDRLLTSNAVTSSIPKSLATVSMPTLTWRRVPKLAASTRKISMPVPTCCQ